MCIISDNIKFCTCIDDNIAIEELNHYWVLNRFNKNKNLDLLGEVMLPFDKSTPNYIENGLKISKALAKTESFDKQIAFKEKDRLQIVLNNTNENSDEVMEYEFEYLSGTWGSIDDADPFYISNYFDEIGAGEIKEVGML